MSAFRRSLAFLVLILVRPVAAWAQLPPDIVAMSIACSNDRVYTWYVQGNVTVGSSSVLGAIQPFAPATPYSLPPGETPGDIVGMGIAGNDRVYVWFRDGTVSSGTSTDLDRYRPRARYTLAPGKTPADVVGIDIACSNDHVYVWYSDNTVSSGTSTDLDKYRGRYGYALPPGRGPRDIVETGIAGNDHVYAWYLDRTISSGTTAKLDQYPIRPIEVSLDDSLFVEPLVRDQRDPSYGALDNPAVRPLGGGAGYARIVPRPDPVNHAGDRDPALPRGKVVRTVAELRAALSAPGSEPRLVYVDDAATLDLSFCAQRPGACADPRSGPPSCGDYTLAVPAHTTLASGRGRNGSRGGRLLSRTFTNCPLLDVNAPGVRITGLRIQGPDTTIENDERVHCDGESGGIRVSSDGPLRRETEIDNNELSNWPRAAVEISRVLGVRVHHNVIKYNRRIEHNGTCGPHKYALGYGVVVGPGSAIIEANIFDHNRHDIASDGQPGSFYTATYNVVMTGAISHSFDVHGGKDRDDSTHIAGTAFVIHHNTFLQWNRPAVLLRGVPIRGAWVYKNETADDVESGAFQQSNASGRLSVWDNKINVRRSPPPVP